MKKLILILSAVLTLCACRVNNGDIGDFFGSWLVESLTVDGVTPEDFDNESSYWEFQNNIIKVTYVSDRLETEGRWGTWTDEGQHLLLDFTHYENGVEPGTGQYKAPEWLYMPQGRVIDLTFASRSSKRMKLWFTDSEGARIEYSLRKIW